MFFFVVVSFVLFLFWKGSTEALLSPALYKLIDWVID